MERVKKIIPDATIRFAGDSGDGMQLVGKKFADATASEGADVNTFPDFPSEIRAPEGTLYGVSAFQIRLGSKEIDTHGDVLDVLIAMNASSLKVNLPMVKKGGVIIANAGGFDSRNLKLAGFDENPLENDSLKEYKLLAIDIEKVLKSELTGLEASPKAVRKAKNFFTLGFVFWLFSYRIDTTEMWIEKKFRKNEEALMVNQEALRKGWIFAAEQSGFDFQFQIGKRKFSPGFYRNISGNQATALGLVAAAKKANIPLFLGSYPITPATEILQFISGYKKYGVKHLQAEDEIAGITSAIGASYGGYLAATTTSGPGLSLKTEALGLAVMTELPLVVINVMRAGPSTGMPTKPEQSDLFQAMFGRHGESPMPVVAAASPSDCFDMTMEATRIALKYMTPVLLLTDGYIGQSSEPWKIPSEGELPDLHKEYYMDPANFKPYMRDATTLARPWVVPGTPGMEHRIGGLEKTDVTGAVSYDAVNHQKMTELRQNKIDGIQNDIPEAVVKGPDKGELLIIGWGGTYGAINSAVEELLEEDAKVSFVHLKHLNPMPKNIGELLNRFERILIPEMNMGQLQWLLQARFMKPIIGYHKVQGQPFTASEIKSKVMSILKREEVVS